LLFAPGTNPKFIQFLMFHIMNYRVFDINIIFRLVNIQYNKYKSPPYSEDLYNSIYLFIN